MAALLPFIQDLLPMILPSQVHITRGRDLFPELAPPSKSSQPKDAAAAFVTEENARATSRAATRQTPARAVTVENGPIELTEVDESAGEDALSGGDEKVVPDDTGPRERDTPRPTGRGGGGVVVRDAIVNKTDRMCASVMFAAPHSSSPVHHNSEHDTIIYAASGRGILATSPPDNYSDDEEQPPKQQELEPGDFAFIPAWTEHQLINETGESVVWVVIQGGSAPIVVPLTDWGGSEQE